MKLFSTTSIFLAAAFALAVGGLNPAMAQEKKKPTVKSKHGEWEVRCLEKRCTMTQTFKDPEGRPVIVFSLQKLAKPKKLEKGGTVVAQARVITPLHVLLPNRLGLRVAGEDKVSATPFLMCNPLGCESRPQVMEDIVAKLKKAKELEVLTAIPTAQGPQVVAVKLPLEGFEKAYNDL